MVNFLIKFHTEHDLVADSMINAENKNLKVPSGFEQQTSGFALEHATTEPSGNVFMCVEIWFV